MSFLKENLSVSTALCRCGHTLAKVLEEFNYVKFTVGDEEVWRVELELA